MVEAIWNIGKGILPWWPGTETKNGSSLTATPVSGWST